MMKRLLFIFTILVLAVFSTFAQSPKPTPKGAKTTVAKSNKLVLKEKEDFEKARSLTDLGEKITALQKFAADYPTSKDLTAIGEMLAIARAQLGDEKLRANENEAAIKLYKEAITEAPTPVSEQVFADFILHFPTKLFYRNQPEAAVEVAKMIEEKVSDNAKQLVGVAAFYVGAEKSAEAKRIAEKAIELDSTLPVAYQTLGLANRLNFDLAESANAYAKALELDPNSVVSKRNLAEMKRAIGKSEEAVALYRELTEKEPNDIQAQTGLILSLFDADKAEEAETILAKSLETTPNNVVLLTGAAYWYAANNNPDKAIDLANKAISVEPRYVWSRIALARGLMLKNQPFEAEKVLIVARQYGDFPTLDYELATARFQAGFFEEAARDLKRRFYVKDNYVQTYVAGRIAKEAETFTELLGLERQASIFTPKAADNAETSEQIKRLFDFRLKLEAKEATEEDINKAIDEFTKGDDRMKTHRQLYAANRLLDAKKNLPKVLELTQSAVKGVDSSLEISFPAAVILADELLESRTLAISRGEVIVTPEVPRQILSRIVRGRIEELTGWMLYEQDKPQEAIIRLKRALSILPEKSAFWRSSLWRLGRAQFAVGNLKEALESYIKSYNEGQPDRFRRSTIEVLYLRLNGTTDGLDKLIGANPFGEIAAVTATPTPEPTPNPTPEIVPASTPDPKPKVTPEVTPTPSETEKVETTPTPTPEAKTSATPETKSEPTPTPEIKTETSPSPTPEIKAETTPTPETKTEPTTTTSPTPKPLFDPIVITVPKSDTKSTETEKTVENKESEKKDAEQTKENTPKSTEPPKEDQVAENVSKTTESISRPRLVTEKTEETPKSEEPPSCLVSSQNNLSILSNGGNLGILVGYVNEGDISKIKAESSNPSEVSVSFDPGIGRQSNRAFFVIKSISDNKGLFTITFTSPCGKKDVQVRVR